MTVSWNDTLLVNEPEVAVTVIEYVPVGVPLTCAGVLVPLLQAGCSNTSAKNRDRVNNPSQRLRRCFLPKPTPSRLIPGTINHSAYSGLCQGAEATVVTGCGVVVKFNLLDCGPLSVSVLEVKLQAVPVGGALQVSDTLAPNAGCGVTSTVYKAV